MLHSISTASRNSKRKFRWMNRHIRLLRNTHSVLIFIDGVVICLFCDGVGADRRKLLETNFSFPSSCSASALASVCVCIKICNSCVMLECVLGWFFFSAGLLVAVLLPLIMLLLTKERKNAHNKKNEANYRPVGGDECASELVDLSSMQSFNSALWKFLYGSFVDDRPMRLGIRGNYMLFRIEMKMRCICWQSFGWGTAPDRCASPVSFEGLYFLGMRILVAMVRGRLGCVL